MISGLLIYHHTTTASALAIYLLVNWAWAWALVKHLLGISDVFFLFTFILSTPKAFWCQVDIGLRINCPSHGSKCSIAVLGDRTRHLLRVSRKRSTRTIRGSLGSLCNAVQSKLRVFDKYYVLLLYFSLVRIQMFKNRITFSGKIFSWMPLWDVP